MLSVIANYKELTGSPSYEGVDWNTQSKRLISRKVMFSLLRGSGLKSIRWITENSAVSSPSYEGVDWNTNSAVFRQATTEFSLLRGSGLKYPVGVCPAHLSPSSPSYEGVDWNCKSRRNAVGIVRFSLLRGSGLKSRGCNLTLSVKNVLPLTREWIEISGIFGRGACKSAFSLLRGSGLKSNNSEEPSRDYCSPSYEGVDWNCWYDYLLQLLRGSPSYEGVDWNMFCINCVTPKTSFSLLRGSGLKCIYDKKMERGRGSPSYEGVD